MRLKRVLGILLMVIILSLTLIACSDSKKGEPLSRTEFLMDTVITLEIHGYTDEKTLDKAIDRLKEIEKKMSNYVKDSQVNLINSNAGIDPIEVDDDLYYVIERAKYFAEISDGAYEPTIGPLVDLWDIIGVGEKDRNSIPSEEEIEEKMKLVDYNDLELLEGNKVFLKRKGMKLDLGGIAKGYAADEVKKVFEENGVKNAIIDLGGNIYAMGERENGEPWRLGIQDPFESTGDYMGIYSAKSQSIVTSGDYERYFDYDGRRYHHIIDYKTGYPSENEVSGISVTSDLSIDGDALSTALFDLGVDEGMELIEELDDVDVIFITKDDEVIIKGKTEENFRLTRDNLELIVK